MEGLVEQQKTVVGLAYPGPHAKNKHNSTIFSNCTASECMHATMEHWECPRCHTSRYIDACCDVTKRWRLLYWFVWGECPGPLSVIYFYVVECASCAKVLNKPIKVAGNHVNEIHDFCKQLNFSRL